MYTKYTISRSFVSATQLERVNARGRKAHRNRDAGQAPTKATEEERKAAEESNQKVYESRQRAKRREVIMLADNNFENHNSCFVTLTFDTLVSYNEADAAFQKFTKELRRDYADLLYIATIEMWGTIMWDNPHFHMVVNIKDEEETACVVDKHWQHGMYKVREVYNIVRLAHYITKDFESCEHGGPFHGKRIYFHSQGLEHCQELKSWVADHKKELDALEQKLPPPATTDNAYSAETGVITYSTFKMKNNTRFKPYIVAKRR
jgi:hypothetical protein